MPGYGNVCGMLAFGCVSVSLSYLAILSLTRPGLRAHHHRCLLMD